MQHTMEHRRNRVIASPRARRAMRARDVEPGEVRGTGPGGRIVEADVVRASAGSGAPRRALVGDPRRAPYGVASFWLDATADVTSLLGVKGQIDEEVRRACGVPLRLADLLLRAMALALAEFPEANRVWQGETSVALETADVGLEVETASGPLAAAIRQADRLRLFDLVSRRAERAAAAAAGRLPPEVGPGVAITLCDLSDSFIERYAAVLVPPSTSALAVGRPAIRPGAFEGRTGLRQTVTLCLTADRRAVTPETAAKLLGRIVEFLERPILLLCERQPR